MNAIERTLLYALPLALIIVEAIALVVGSPAAPHHFLNPVNRNTDFTVAAVAVTTVTIWRTEATRVLLLGLFLEGLRLTWLAWRHVSLLDSLSSTGLGFWCACLMLAVARVATCPASARRQALDSAALTFALPATIPLLGFFLWLTDILRSSTTYDLYLYVFDGLLPVPIVQIIAVAFAQHHWMAAIFTFVYHILIGVGGIYVVLQRQPDGELRGHLISRWLLAGILGYLLYFVVPAVGPLFAFASEFPNHLPDPSDVKLSLLTILGDEPRNAMPSLHAAWTYLIMIAALKMSRLAQAAALLFTVATLLATMGLGEHYFVDLVVALPFAVAVEAIAALAGPTLTARRIWIAIGASAMTVVWLLTLRYGVDSLRATPWVAGAMVLGTIAASIWLLARLANDQRDRLSGSGCRPSALSARPLGEAARYLFGRREATSRFL